MFKILIVDDESAIRALIRGALKELCAEFKEASTGLEAVNAVNQDSYDLVILDIILTNTGIDGMEAASLIKRNPRTNKTKILMISGLIDLHGNEVETLGVDGVLSKPFTPDRLRRAVKRLLQANKKKAV